MKWSWAGHINRLKDDGPPVSPLGDHMTRKDDKGDHQAVERRPGQILERHAIADDSTRQVDLETAC